MNAEIKSRIDEYIDGRRDEILSDIASLVAIPSVTGEAEENRKALDFLMSRARDFGFETSMTKEGDVAVVDLCPAADSPGEEGAPTLGVLVHVDVVDPGDPAKWDAGPFDFSIRDGCMFGRGVADDKGPVMLSLYAMKAVRDLSTARPEASGVRARPRVRLISGTSEESVWTDIEHYKAQYDAPDFGFSPDGEFPIFNEENGYADVLLTFPAPDGLERLKAGASPNTIPSLAEIKREGREVKIFRGVSAHSSAPEKGDNAILKLCKAYADGVIDNKNGDPPLRFCDFILDNITVTGTPVAPTILRKTGRGVELNLNIRQTPGVRREAIEGAFAAMRDRYGFTYEIAEYLEPMRTNPSQPFLKTMLDVYRSYGLTGGFERARGTSYAKAMENFVSWGPLMPGDPDTAHMENERLPLETAFTAAKLYASYIASWWL
jgi:succinyl-diaminopimelate desuccinylase